MARGYYYAAGKVDTARGVMVRQGYKPRRRPAPKAGGTPVRVRMGVRVRNAGGTTTATTKKVKKTVKAHKSGDNSSFSFATITSPWSSKISKEVYKQIIGRRRRLVSENVTSISTVGQQAYGSILYNVKADLDAFKLDANDAVATNNEVKMFLGKCTTKTWFRNQANHPVKLVIYDLICKNDNHFSNLNAPEEAWVRGNTDYGQVASADKPMAHHIPGQPPSKSPEFVHYWSIEKVTTVMMEPGQQHEHGLVRRYNRIVKSTRWEHVTTNVVKGLTGCILYVWYGSLAHEADNSAVTFAPARIDVAYTEEQEYGFVRMNLPSFTIDSTVFKNTAIVNLDMMGETQDADMDPSNA